MTWRGFALGLLAGLALLYAAMPWLAEWVLPRLLARHGIVAELVVGYPGWHGIEVERVSLHAPSFDAVGNGVHVRYDPAALARGELAAVTVQQLTVLLGGELGAGAPDQPFELPAFWSLVPARHVAIETLDIGTIDPPARAHGSLSFDPALLSLHLDVTSPRLAAPVQVAATLDPATRLTLTVTPAGATAPLLAMHGTADASRQLAVDADVDLDGEALALLAAFGGVDDAHGELHLRAHGRLPWPLPVDFGWRDVSGDGSVAGYIEGRLRNSQQAEVRLDATVRADAGRITAELAAGSQYRGGLTVVPAALVGRGPATVSVRAAAPVAIVYSDAESRVGDGLVLGVDGLIAPLTLKPRGAWRSDGTFELTVTSAEGAPRLLVAGKRVDGADRAVSAHGRVVLAGRLLALLGRAFGISDTGGQTTIDFDGRLPLAAAGPAIANALGKGRIEANVSGLTAQRSRFEAALAADYQVADGTANATLDPGARFELTATDVARGAAQSSIAASTIAAAPIEVALASGDVVFGKTDVQLALPPVDIGKQQLRLSGAWLTLTRTTLRGDLIDAAALVRARTGRDALPLQVVVHHDLGSGRGRFTLAADWRVTKPLLATQLGLKLPYDLDAGKLELDLHGVFNLAAEPRSLRGNGRLHAEGDGHDDNMRVRGLVAELPLAFDSSGYSIADGAVRIAEIDAGFPVSRVTLELAVDDDVAHIAGLRGELLGGSFSTPAFDYAIEPETATLTVALRGIELAQVLALEGDDVKGNGSLDGELPMHLEGDAFSIADGHVKARPPGGIVSYKGSAGRAVTQTGLDFVLKALQDFHYDTLESDVALAPDGALKLAVRLHGRNPAVEKGRAIQFNLNLTESMPALFESLRAAQGITDRIESRLSR